jgi:hypothetical protein
MTQRSAIIFVLIAVLSLTARAQVTSLQGRVLDGRAKSPMVGATVRLINSNDTTKILIATTSADGSFIIPGPGLHAYDLEITYIGYVPIAKFVRITEPHMSLGDILMTQSVVPLSEVLVQGKAIPAIQKADTTELNAKAFKTNPDADAGDLLAKMPGITVDNGAVKAQGEDVQQVLVDGKPFFGSDPTLALRNLPADAIDKIQVYDKMSDQAEFTGFDDGQAIKTINIVTRPERRNRQFGKGYAGAGDEERYLAGGGVNSFQGDRRISVIGLSNNVNQQNFSTQDLLGVIGNANQRGGFGGGGGRRGGGGGGGGFGGPGGGGPPGGGNIGNFLIGQQSGITTTSSLGLNFTDTWWSRLEMNQSYFFNVTHGENDQKLNRRYYGTPDSITLYNENSNSDSRNYNHRIDTRMEYTPDSSNSIIEQPRLYFQNNRASSLLDGTNTLSTSEPVSLTENNNQSNTSGYNLSNHLIFRHKLGAPGRTISIDFGAGINRKQGTSLQQSFSEYFRDSANVKDTSNLQTPILTDGYSLSSRLAYTEPIAASSMIQLTYNPSYTSNEADNRKYRFNSQTQTYSDLVNSLSNTYRNEYITNNAGVGYRFRATGLNIMAGASYQVASLRGQQDFPFSNSLAKTFYNILPNAMLTYNAAAHSNIRIFYRTSTSPPQISQMQNVVDNTNPLLLTTGNPDLKQSLSSSFISRLSFTNQGDARSLFIFFTLSNTRDYIGNYTLTAANDTVVNRGIRLNRGTQLSYPVNLDGYWNVQTFLTYGIPAQIISSNVNLNSEFTYTRTPGLINGGLNLANTFIYSAGTTLGSNISENVDFTLSYTGNYTISRNTLEPDQDSHYFYHTANMKFNLLFWDGMVFRNEMSNILYTGLSSSYNQNYLLWNIALGKKFLSDQKGEIRLTVTDLLNQNKSVNRTITETYVEDTQNEVLGRYSMLTLTYTLR